MKEVIVAVRQAIPDAASQPPGFVFGHVLSALKQAQAKTINNVENALNTQFEWRGVHLRRGRMPRRD